MHSKLLLVLSLCIRLTGTVINHHQWLSNLMSSSTGPLIFCLMVNHWLLVCKTSYMLFLAKPRLMRYVKVCRTWNCCNCGLWHVLMLEHLFVQNTSNMSTGLKSSLNTCFFSLLSFLFWFCRCNRQRKSQRIWWHKKRNQNDNFFFHSKITTLYFIFSGLGFCPKKHKDTKVQIISWSGH